MEWLLEREQRLFHLHFLPGGLGLSYVQDGRQVPLRARGNTANQGILARGGDAVRFGTARYSFDLERLWQTERTRLAGQNIEDAEIDVPVAGRQLVRGLREQHAFQLPVRPEDAIYPFQQWVNAIYPAQGGFTTLHPDRNSEQIKTKLAARKLAKSSHEGYMLQLARNEYDANSNSKRAADVMETTSTDRRRLSLFSAALKIFMSSS